jgi:membrane peptidoglycan carboxypeptidase
MYCPPTPIESVTDSSGKPVPVSEQPCEQVVDPRLANTLMTGLGKDDQPGGTAANAAAETGWARPLSAKTGTTQDNKSAAFLGFTPGLAGAAITFDDSSSPRSLCDGSPPSPCSRGNLFGGTAPARTWFKAMTSYLGASPVQPLPPTDPRYVRGGTNAQIPDVVGRQVGDAVNRLDDAGFATRRKDVASRAPAGTVVGQDPRGSTLPDQVVELSVSTGSVPAPPAPPGSPGVVAPAVGPAGSGSSGSGG